MPLGDGAANGGPFRGRVWTGATPGEGPIAWHSEGRIWNGTELETLNSHHTGKNLGPELPAREEFQGKPLGGRIGRIKPACEHSCGFQMRLAHCGRFLRDTPFSASGTTYAVQRV